jgi:hypothetical protein
MRDLISFCLSSCLLLARVVSYDNEKRMKKTVEKQNILIAE